MYTSGTTGDPKGVMISNESIITLIAGVDRLLSCMNEQVIFYPLTTLVIFEMFFRNCYCLLDALCFDFDRLLFSFAKFFYLTLLFSLEFLQLKESDVYLSYLPLAHIFDRVIEELFIFNGASIGFWRGVSDLMP